jgi:hypothetical protein
MHQYAPWMLTAVVTTLALVLYFFFLLLEVAHRQSSALLSAQSDLSLSSQLMVEYQTVLGQQAEVAARLVEEQRRLMTATPESGGKVSEESARDAEDNLANLQASIADLGRLSNTLDGWTIFLDRLNATLGACLVLGASLGLTMTLLQLAQVWPPYLSNK